MMKKALLTGVICVSALLLSCGSNFEPFPDFMGRHGHTAVVAGGLMYVFGGHDGGDFLNDLWKYDPATDQWTKLNPASSPSPPPARAYHAAVSDGTNMYVIGGYREDDQGTDVYYDDMWRYEPNTGADGTWFPVGGYSGPQLMGHSAVVVSTDVYLFGGHDGTDFQNDLYRCLLTTGACSPLSPANTPAVRAFHSAAVNGSTMYILGGWDEDLDLYMSDVHTISLPGGDWAVVPTTTALPLDAFHSAVYFGTELFFFGGKVASTNAVWQYPGTYTNNTIAFVSGDKTITDSESKFIDAGFEAGDSIVVSGTVFNDGTYTIVTVAAGVIDVAEPVADETPLTATLVVDDWVRKGIPTTSPATRYAHTAVILNDTVSDKMYVFGGWSGSFDYSDLWAYDPSTNTWEQKASIPSQ